MFVVHTCLSVFVVVHTCVYIHTCLSMCACIFQGQFATAMLQKKIKIQKGKAKAKAEPTPVAKAKAKAKAKADPVAKANAKPNPVPKGILKNVSPKTKAKAKAALESGGSCSSISKLLKKPAAILGDEEDAGVDTYFIQMVLHVCLISCFCMCT